jgi:hypothetical protein
MRFLARLAFWLGLVVLLLPAPPQQGASAPEAGAKQTSTATQADRPPRTSSQHTLTPADLTPPWRAPQPRGAGATKPPA